MVNFTTDIDCCKKFMANISGLSVTTINPLVGDRVLVYRDTGLDVYLVVVGRRWTLTNGSKPVLHCELHLLPGCNISMIEKVLRS